MSNAPNLDPDELSQVPYDLQLKVGTYIATDEGTINTAAMVTKYKIHLLMDANPDIQLDPENLTPEQIAIVWNAYRAAYPERGSNYQLALPVAEYLIQLDRE